MTLAQNKRLLQAVVAVLALIPVLAGGIGVLAGPGFVMGSAPWPVDLDSHFRYLSGIFLAVGLTFYATLPGIERKTALFRLATAIVVAGGLGRLLSLFAAGTPGPAHLAGLCLELLVVPGLALWQARVARRARSPEGETP